MSTLPFADYPRLAIWLAACATAVGVPGWLLVARHARALDGPTRAGLALAAGLLVSPLVALALSLAGIPVCPATHLPAACLVGLALGRSRRWREAGANLVEGVEPLDLRAGLGVLALCAAMTAIALTALRGYAAPNHIDDASNHAFMTWRVLATGSVLPGRVFGAPFGAPPAPYLVGWHSSAAMVAGLAGQPAWLSAWTLPVLAGALMPLALSFFWRACRLPAAVALLGGAFAVANYYTPLNIFSWGGFGAIVGLYLAPWIAVALRAGVRRPTAAGAALAGAALVAIVYVHTSELVTALLLAAVAWTAGPPVAAPRGARWRAAALAAGVLVAFGVLPLLAELRFYRGWTAAEALPPPVALRDAAAQFLTFAGGNVPVLHWFVAPALATGLAWRRGRRLGLPALALATLYFGLRAARDPVSLALSQPFYRQYARLVYPQMYLLPPLMGAVVAGALAGAGRLWPWRGRRLLALLPLAALVHWVLWPGAYWSYRNLEHQRRLVPFDAADAAFARELRRLLPADAVVANQYGDGSFWAMHASGLRFLDPCSWPVGAREGLSHRGGVAALGQRPWPPEALALRGAGAGYVYVADRVQEGVRPALTRVLLDGDPRFAKLGDDGNAAVYRILWDAGP